MKKSDQVTLTGVCVGIAAGLALRYWLPTMNPWIDFVFGLLVAGGAISGGLRDEANSRIIDSKTVNKRD
jgi:divalent metal cation (Fe/Co/Zn/Cd) transporter